MFARVRLSFLCCLVVVLLAGCGHADADVESARQPSDDRAAIADLHYDFHAAKLKGDTRLMCALMTESGQREAASEWAPASGAARACQQAMEVMVDSLEATDQAWLRRHLDRNDPVDVFFHDERARDRALYWLVIDGRNTEPIAEVVKTAAGWRYKSWGYPTDR